MIDCGADWLRALKAVAPTAIVLTHGHGDHAFGLAKGAPCPVYATAETWSLIDRFPIEKRRIVEARIKVAIGGVNFEAFPVQHSLRAPAVATASAKAARRSSMCRTLRRSRNATRRYAVSRFMWGTAPASCGRWCAFAITC
jgi:phosphoribosyl 1,2-cyclic phosphodiesterase